MFLSCFWAKYSPTLSSSRHLLILALRFLSSSGLTMWRYWWVRDMGASSDHRSIFCFQNAYTKLEKIKMFCFFPKFGVLVITNLTNVKVLFVRSSEDGIWLNIYYFCKIFSFASLSSGEDWLSMPLSLAAISKMFTRIFRLFRFWRHFIKASGSYYRMFMFRPDGAILITCWHFYTFTPLTFFLMTIQVLTSVTIQVLTSVTCYHVNTGRSHLARAPAQTEPGDLRPGSGRNVTVRPELDTGPGHGGITHELDTGPCHGGITL